MIRVYFNRHAEAPNVWSVDLGTQETEVNVSEVVRIGKLQSHTHYNPNIAGRDKYMPRAYEHVVGGTLNLWRDSQGLLIASIEGDLC